MSKPRHFRTCVHGGRERRPINWDGGPSVTVRDGLCEACLLEKRLNKLPSPIGTEISTQLYKKLRTKSGAADVQLLYELLGPWLHSRRSLEACLDYEIDRYQSAELDA